MTSTLLTTLLLAASWCSCRSYRLHASRVGKVSLSRLSSEANVDGVELRSSDLIAVARSFVTTNLGVNDPSLLSESFVCSGPSFNAIDKKSYLLGLTAETAVFERAMPDFNLRPYSFSVDETQSDIVWFKIRPKGTLTGPFSYKGEVYLPNQKVVELPAQQLSVTIRSGQVTRVTAGYSIDRFTGNTAGLAGSAGVLYSLGEAPSKFSYLPPAVVVRQFFARTKKPVQRKPVKISPFPVAVMTTLAKRVIETSFGAEEPSLLAPDYQFAGPVVGPLGKEEFVNALKSFSLKSLLPDLITKSYCFEVDSYDPERVWAISRGSGTQTGELVLGGKVLGPATGNPYQGAPEAVSLSFNEQGLCYRATAGYILDKEEGNTNGLGGVFGIFEAIGTPLPWWETRAVSELPGLIKNSLFAPSKAAKPTAVRATPSRASVKIESPAEPIVSKPTPIVERPVNVAAPAPLAAAVVTPAPAKVTPAPAKVIAAPVSKKVEKAVVRAETIKVPAMFKPAPAPAPVPEPVAPSKSASVSPKSAPKKENFFSFLQQPQSKPKPSPELQSPAVPAVVRPAKNVKKSPLPFMQAPDKKSAPVPQKVSPTKKNAAVADASEAVEVAQKEKEKPKGGMFSMKISKGSTGKLTTGSSALKNEKK
jgi:hypothetical protein